jgi:hypothetical protein
MLKAVMHWSVVESQVWFVSRVAKMATRPVRNLSHIFPVDHKPRRKLATRWNGIVSLGSRMLPKYLSTSV